MTNKEAWIAQHREKVDWIVTHDGSQNPFGHECLRCGAYHKLPNGLTVDKFVTIAQAFIALHKECERKP